MNEARHNIPLLPSASPEPLPLFFLDTDPNCCDVDDGGQLLLELPGALGRVCSPPRAKPTTMQDEDDSKMQEAETAAAEPGEGPGGSSNTIWGHKASGQLFGLPTSCTMLCMRPEACLLTLQKLA
jgi:hypothetical protein